VETVLLALYFQLVAAFTSSRIDMSEAEQEHSAQAQDAVPKTEEASPINIKVSCLGSLRTTWDLVSDTPWT
jgi:hypothetical protein